jgi:hypothetical protein
MVQSFLWIPGLNKFNKFGVHKAPIENLAKILKKGQVTLRIYNNHWLVLCDKAEIKLEFTSENLPNFDVILKRLPTPSAFTGVGPGKPALDAATPVFGFDPLLMERIAKAAKILRVNLMARPGSDGLDPILIEDTKRERLRAVLMPIRLD